MKFINNLPQELVHKIKEYVLSREVILKLFYQKHEINEETLEKAINVHNKRTRKNQLEIFILQDIQNIPTKIRQRQFSIHFQ